jgi:hypothetical protein
MALGRPPGRSKKIFPSFTDEEVPVIKRLIQAAALLAACSGAAHASAYDFSYTFTNNSTLTPPIVTGSFDGTLSGNLLTNITDVSVAVNGAAFNGQLFIGSWDSSAGTVNFAANTAVVSTNGALNNFVIADTHDPSLSTFTNLFYYVSGTTPDSLGSQEVSLQNVFGPSAFDNDALGGVGTWSLTPAPVPLPAALPLLASGLGLIAAAKRRRREAAAA